MNDRIQEALDGDRARAALEDDERRDLDELEGLVRESLAFVHENRAPDVEARVMARIAEMDAARDTAPSTPSSPPEAAASTLVGLVSGFRSGLRWLWNPRSVRVRPAWALALPMLAAVAVGLGPRLVDRGAAGPAASAASAAAAAATAGSSPTEVTLYVRFELESSDAASVALAGSFTDWQPRYRLSETAPGRWSALVPLPPGVHDYAFVVNGERWIPDPDAVHVDDGFGGVNSRIALLDPQA